MKDSRSIVRVFAATLWFVLGMMASTYAQDPSAEKEPWESQQLSRGKLWSIRCSLC